MPGPRRQTRADRSSRIAHLSRLVALALRHRPEEMGLALDAGGFVPLETLAEALRRQPGWESVTQRDLLEMASADPRRYEVRDGRIRARYGHTVAVAQPGEAAFPPEWLYHGTSPAEAARMAAAGLRPAGRQLVHLSATSMAALEIGKRRAPDAVVVVVFARRAAAAGIEFRRAGHGIFLTARVPPEFLLIPHGARAERTRN
jgi:putative RNA 2'-phosphotransferase